MYRLSNFKHIYSCLTASIQIHISLYVTDSSFTVGESYSLAVFERLPFSKYAQILPHGICSDWLCCCWCCVNMQTQTDSSTASSTWSAVPQHLELLCQPIIQRHAAMLVSIMLAFMLRASTHRHISVYKWRSGNLLIELWEKQSCNCTADTVNKSVCVHVWYTEMLAYLNTQKDCSKWYSHFMSVKLSLRNTHR